ncbi:MAG: FxLYD domain-containing protein [bacterium]|nr:FxLYD domain-containing protein [bacterium]MDD5756704.1 FxLYD domain-containing protein [bacterium]
MPLIKCRECGHMISTQAAYCPNCGVSPNKISMESEIRLVILLVILILALLVAARMPLLRNIFIGNWSNKENLLAEVASVQINYSQSYRPVPDRIAVTGEVKNLSTVTLPDVEVTIHWLDKYGNLVGTDTARIQAQPLYAGRVSSFEVISIYQDDMIDYQLSFRTMAGGHIASKNKK